MRDAHKGSSRRRTGRRAGTRTGGLTGASVRRAQRALPRSPIDVRNAIAAMVGILAIRRSAQCARVSTQTYKFVCNDDARSRTCADHALSGILDVEAVVVEGAERADNTDQDGHGMRVALEACSAGARV
jgi:hypothetical protein